MKITLETKLSKKTNSVYVAAFAHFRYKKQLIAFGDVALELFDYSADISFLEPDLVLCEGVLTEVIKDIKEY